MRLSNSLSFALALVVAGSGCSLIVDGALTGGGPPPSSCDGLDDGTPCERMGITAPLVCRGGVCANSRCGDGQLDPRSEGCDDGNEVGGDGCEADCTVTVGCRTDDDCIPLDDECLDTYCESSSGECLVGAITDGTGCIDDLGRDGECSAGLCVLVGCQDGVLDVAAGELCDDGNALYGDGCSPECKPECTLDGDCSQDPCFGAQTCMTSTGPDGDMLGTCVATSSPVDCGNPECSYCDSSSGVALCLFGPGGDADGDGYANAGCGGDDCNDAEFGINPGRVEECDPAGEDINCNATDEPASTEWFADCDGDGYAAVGAETITACERPPAPSSCTAGYWTSRSPLTSAPDCLDTGTAGADVHPNQYGFFSASYTTAAGGTSFDYNCSGSTEPEHPEAADPSTMRCGAPPCTRQTAYFPQRVSCGSAALLYSCDDYLLSCARFASARPVTKRCH